MSLRKHDGGEDSQYMTGVEGQLGWRTYITDEPAATQIKTTQMPRRRGGATSIDGKMAVELRKSSETMDRELS
jgi:hypothetical protein